MIEIESMSIQISTNHMRFASPNGGSSRAAGEGGYLSLECHLTPKLHALRNNARIEAAGCQTTIITRIEVPSSESSISG